MRIYDEENLYDDILDDDMSGYTVVDDNSIFKLLAPEPDPETIASPIPENEQTVILCEPSVSRGADGQELELRFSDSDGCDVFASGKRIGCFKSAYVKKLKNERGGQLASAFYKNSVPPMIKLVFGSGASVPPPGK